MRMPSAPTFLSSVGIHSVDTRDEQADDEAADQGAERGPEPAEGDGGEDEQQDLEAHLEVHALRQAEQDAGQPGQRRAGDPDHLDDAVDVDAGRRGQRGVVGDRAGRLADPGPQQGEADADQHDDGDAPC